LGTVGRRPQRFLHRSRSTRGDTSSSTARWISTNSVSQKSRIGPPAHQTDSPGIIGSEPRGICPSSEAADAHVGTAAPGCPAAQVYRAAGLSRARAKSTQTNCHPERSRGTLGLLYHPPKASHFSPPPSRQLHSPALRCTKDASGRGSRGQYAAGPPFFAKACRTSIGRSSCSDHG
jgi:hypothetical protein